MTFEQVVLTLTPVYSPDSLPFRSLTFSSNDDTIPIGRASKSEIKNLVPEHDNGWFESRVMSRNHAVLSVSMEHKTVYIRDHGSLHGTQLNDIKINAKENVIVRTGDVLTFGSEISRGTETFRPIAVRLDCQWHESKQQHAPKQTTNTFSVPDDEEDEDVIEVVDSREVHVQPKTPQNISDSSDLDYGSDMSGPLDLTSPVTSPEVKISELPKQPATYLKEVGGTSQQPLTGAHDSELSASIQSEPLHNGYESELESDDVDSNSESVDSAADKVSDFDDEESESDESENDQDESSDLPEQGPSSEVQTGFHILGPYKSQNQSSNSEPLSEIVLPGINTSPAQPEFTANGRGPTSTTLDPAPMNSTNYNIPWPEYLIPRIPSPSDKAMAKPMATPASNHHFNDIPTSDFDMFCTNQGPSHTSYQEAVNLSTNPYGSVTANESFPFGPHRSSGYLRHLAGDFLDRQPPASEEKSFDNFLSQSNETSTASKEAVKTTEAPITRLSIADIVEKTAASSDLKRKINEFEADLDSNPVKIGDSQDSIPDAQPRPDMHNIELSQANISEADSTHKAATSRAEEHRRKRIKTKETRTFLKYATIAAVGAVVGSIGTIAGLASLPTDFFN